MADRSSTYTAEYRFVNRVRRELIPFLPLQICSFFLRDIFRKIETMLDKYDRRPLKTYGIMIYDDSDDDIGHFEQTVIDDDPHPKTKLLHGDISRSAYIDGFSLCPWIKSEQKQRPFYSQQVEMVLYFQLLVFCFRGTSL